MTPSRMLATGLSILMAASFAAAQSLPPTITTGSPLPSGVVGAPYSQTLSASGGFTPYTWSLAGGSLPPGLGLSSGGTISGTPSTAGSYGFVVRVTDARQVSSTKSFTVNIAPGGTTQGPDGEIGVLYSATLVALSGIPPFTWRITSGQLPPGLLLNSSTGVISGTPTTAGTFGFGATWTDSQGNSFPNTFSIRIYPELVITTSSPLPSGVLGAAYLLGFGVEGGKTPYSGSISGALPPGLTFDTAGLTLRGAPTAAGTFSFTLTVSDALSTSRMGVASKQFSLTVTTVTISGINPSSVPAGSPAFTLTVTGANFVPPPVTFAGVGSQVRWNGTALPTSYVSSTQLQATVSAQLVANPGFAAVDVLNPNSVSSNVVTFTILEGLAITTASPWPSGSVGTAYSLTLAATGGTQPYSWRVVEGTLPSGLALGVSNGVVSGTPTVAGTGSVQISVSDSAGRSASKVFAWTVNAPTLAITTASPLASATVGTAYSQSLSATGGVAPYTWSLASGTPPPGLALSTSGVLSGTPAQSGTFTFSVTVTDSARATASKQFVLTVNPAALSITTASPLPGASAGSSYSQSLSATGGSAPYTWSLASGTLPSGVALSTGGVLSGTPAQSGTFTFSVTVTDSARTTASKQFVLTVSAATLSITTASPLPGASAGSAYSQTFAVSGGIAPYSWSVVSGTLPAGLTLSAGGVLSGTPTQGGAYNFTVGVTDTSRASATKAFDLTISVPQAPTPSVTGLTDTVSPAQQPAFDVQLASPYALEITGTLTLSFTPDAVTPADDPAIQFSSGGRTLSFTIPAGQTRAFPASSPAIQTGTVAGRIVLTLRFSGGGQDITPTPAPTRSVQIARSAPRINSVQVVNRTSAGFTVVVTGYSTPRQVTQAVFSFTPASGGNLQTSQLTVPVDSTFTTWFTGSASGQFGSTFRYTQPFQVQGDVSAIGSVSVTLTNSAGSSQPASASF